LPEGGDEDVFAWPDAEALAASGQGDFESFHGFLQTEPVIFTDRVALW
jgi:hypothetical protein